MNPEELPEEERLDDEAALGVDLTPPVPTPVPAVHSDAAEMEMRRLSRRSFSLGAVAVAAGYGAFHWLFSRRPIDGAPWPLRSALGINEQIAEDLFSDKNLAPTFPPKDLGDRENGDDGLSEDIDLDAWRLKVISVAVANLESRGEPSVLLAADSDKKGGSSDSDGSGSDDSTPPGPPVTETVLAKLTLADIKKLKRVDLVTEFKCIEGWSQRVQWTGVKFADFAARYGPGMDQYPAPERAQHLRELPRYVGMETPDGGYYVGVDVASALHPQTLLCYAMNGEPLTQDHGAPLRLVIPTKYGVKNLKRIGTIRFTDRRPPDFWAEQGYDWYCGL